jgi:hypothetical protein
MFTAIKFYFYFQEKVEMYIENIIKSEKIIDDFEEEESDNEFDNAKT